MSFIYLPAKLRMLTGQFNWLTTDHRFVLVGGGFIADVTHATLADIDSAYIVTETGVLRNPEIVGYNGLASDSRTKVIDQDTGRDVSALLLVDANDELVALFDHMDYLPFNVAQRKAVLGGEVFIVVSDIEEHVWLRL